MLIISFAPASFFDPHFVSGAATSAEGWNLFKVDNTYILRIIPATPFSASTLASLGPVVQSAQKNFAAFRALPSLEAFVGSVLDLAKSLKASQTALFVEDVHRLSDYFAEDQIAPVLCQLQFSCPAVFPLYLVMNSEIPAARSPTYSYRCTGTLRLKNCVLRKDEYRGQLESTMLNSLKQYKEELADCSLPAAGGEMRLEEHREAPKEETKEEPKSTFKLGMSRAELAERQKVAGPFHTGAEEEDKATSGETEEKVEDDINDDEGEEF